MSPLEIGGDVAAFQFDVAALISLIVACAVTGLLFRDCLGRSRTAITAAGLLLIANIALGCAAEPVTWIALWQLHWFLAWGISLFLADEDVQSWLGRMLVAGWLLDTGLIAAGLTLLPQMAEAEGSRNLLLIPVSALALSLAARVPVLPIGAHRLWGDRSPRSAVSWILLTCLVPATVAGLRIIEALEVTPSSRLRAGEMLLFAAMAGALSSLRQESSTREAAWRLSAVVGGAAAISLAVIPWLGRTLWLATAVIVLAGSRRMSDVFVSYPPRQPSSDLLGRLEAAAADEWNIPRLWRFLVVLPLRGASQVVRFVDGFLFEQLPAQAGRRLAAAVSPVTQAIPESTGRAAVQLICALAMFVLLALAFR